MRLDCCIPCFLFAFRVFCLPKAAALVLRPTFSFSFFLYVFFFFSSCDDLLDQPHEVGWRIRALTYIALFSETARMAADSPHHSA